MLQYLERALRFVGRNIFRNTSYFIAYAVGFLRTDFRLFPNYFTETELLAALQSGKSLIRLGDGEVYIMNFGSVHYQKYTPRLRVYFLEMVREYREDSPYLLGIPQEYMSKSNTELRAVNLLHCWLPFKVTYQRLFTTKAKYFDAHVFYRGNSFQKMLEGILVDKKVLLIASRDNWLLMKEAGMDQKLNVEWIECPSSNAFDEFDSLLQQILERIAEDTIDEYRVLASAGPASKALVYELSKKGIIAYDLGKGIEAVYRPNTIEKSI